MIDKTMLKLEEAIEQASDITPARKAELRSLIEEMRLKLPESEKDDLQESKATLGKLIPEFEVSNPELASLINRISLMLSNIGV